jgi:hypothetical protein
MGGYLRGSCPLGCSYSVSLWQTDSGRPRARCFGGCNEDEVLAAVALGGEIELPTTPPSRVHDERRVNGARLIYRHMALDRRTEVYLRSRGIRRTSSILRFSEQAPHRLGIRVPAIGAPIVNAAGEMTAVHMTYVRRNGDGKADFVDKEHQRECRGPIAGCSIRLLGDDHPRELLIGEGIESTLSAAELFDIPAAWSAINATGLSAIRLPRSVRAVVIAADADIAGWRNALRLQERCLSEGIRVRIVSPKIPGEDFNDVLRRGRDG